MLDIIHKYIKFLSTPSARRATAPPRTGPAQGNEFLSTPSARRATRWSTFADVAALFLSTPSARRATPEAWSWQTTADHFYPRPPRGGRLFSLFSGFLPLLISIHALREEGDFSPQIFFMPCTISIHALREEGDEPPTCAIDGCFLFLSTPSARRATREKNRADQREMISIHALREEGDCSRFKTS